MLLALAVVLEQILNLRSLQQHLRILINSTVKRILHFLLILNTLSDHPWNEGRYYFFTPQFPPIDATQPLMPLKLLNAIVPQPSLLVPPQQPIHEIKRLQTPTHRQLLLRHPRLMRQYPISDLLATIPHIRPLRRHKHTEPIIIS